MQPEIEAKFLNINHDQIRQRLREAGATLEKPMRLMRRTVFDYPDGRIEHDWGRLRVRDEGDKITITFKNRGKDQYSNEIETTVGSYEVMLELLQAIGLKAVSVQETKRETWHYQNVEVVLDEWPWVKPFMEIEGKSEPDIQACAAVLGLDWKQAAFGSAETAYRAEYSRMTTDDRVNAMAVMNFGDPLPAWLAERK